MPVWRSSSTTRRRRACGGSPAPTRSSTSCSSSTSRPSCPRWPARAARRTASRWTRCARTGRTSRTASRPTCRCARRRTAAMLGRGGLGCVVPGQRPDFALGRRPARGPGTGDAGRRARRHPRLPAGRGRCSGHGDDPHRFGGHRGNHVLHQHVQPDRDDRSGAARPKRGRADCGSSRPSRPRWHRARRQSPAISRRPD